MGLLKIKYKKGLGYGDVGEAWMMENVYDKWNSVKKRTEKKEYM